MSEELTVLKEVCRRLEQADISYMLTGSLAANFYTVPRMTRDIDFVIEILPTQVDQFLRCFQNDFYVEKTAILEAISYRKMFNIIHNQSIYKVDFVIRKDSSYRTTEFQRRRRLPFGADAIWIVSPEDLIISKLHWGKDSMSELQIRDVKNLLSLKNLDHEYIRHWVELLKLHSIYEKAAST